MFIILWRLPSNEVPRNLYHKRQAGNKNVLLMEEGHRTRLIRAEFSHLGQMADIGHRLGMRVGHLCVNGHKSNPYSLPISRLSDLSNNKICICSRLLSPNRTVNNNKHNMNLKAALCTSLDSAAIHFSQTYFTKY